MDFVHTFIEHYHQRFVNSWTRDTSADEVRFVVLDSETTGADPRNAKLITIGAVAVMAGQIFLSDSMEETIWTSYNSPSVTVHGITRDETRNGLPEAEALEALLKYLGDGVIVGHHIDHDMITISRAVERLFGARLQNESLDTMDLSLHLRDDGVFPSRLNFEDFSLDALSDLFGIECHDRHTAGGDAFITAQIFIRLLRLARKAGRNTLGSLTVPYAGS